MSKIAYLTIDDSPSKYFAERVEYLTQRNIVAVWFCLGEHLEVRRAEVVAAIQAGQIIANHSWDHPHFSKIKPQVGIEQIVRTDELIEELYAEAGVSRPAKWFRFPYFDKGGRHKDEYQAALAEMGFSHPELTEITYDYFGSLRADHDWSATLDAMEWVYDSHHEVTYHLHSMADVQRRLLHDEPEKQLGLHSTSADIILIHDQVKSDDRFIPLVEFFLEQDVTFTSPL